MTKSRRSIKFAWLTLLGIPGDVWCGMTHVCIDGHLWHDSMPLWWLFCDYIWVAVFAAAAISVLRSDVRHRLIPFSVLLFLIGSRMLLASGGGGLYIFELPLLIYLGVHSVITLCRVRQQIRQQKMKLQNEAA